MLLLAILLLCSMAPGQAAAAPTKLTISKAVISDGQLQVEGQSSSWRRDRRLRLQTQESRLRNGKAETVWITRSTGALPRSKKLKFSVAAGGTSARLRVQLLARLRVLATSRAVTVQAPSPETVTPSAGAPAPLVTDPAAPAPSTPSPADQSPKPAPPSPADTLTPGQALGTGEQIASPNGRFRLTMQGDGNLVLYRDGPHAVWATATGGPGMTAVMQRDGNLVVGNASGPKWSSSTAGLNGAFLRVQDDGNLVVYYGDRAVWTPGSGYQGHVLSSGAQLTQETLLRSPNGRFRLVMQGDGNMVIYRDGPHAIWEIGAGGTGAGGKAIMQADGNLVVGVPRGVTWAAGTNGFGGANLVMQDDGNAVIYHNGHAIWTWGSGYIGDSLLGGTELVPGAYLKSDNKQLTLIMQGDGNLVFYRDGVAALWSSRTGAPASQARAVMQGDGNLVVYQGAKALWSAQTGLPGSRVVAQDDENLVIYAPQGAVWSSKGGAIGGGTPPGGSTGGYPDAGAVACGFYEWCLNGTAMSPRGYFRRNCTDWAAWRLQQMGASDAATRGLGNGGQWGSMAGRRTSGTPKVGRAAVKPSTGSGDFGHVAVVETVHGNGQITISEYNRYSNGTYSTWTGTPSSRGFTQFVDMGI